MPWLEQLGRSCGKALSKILRSLLLRAVWLGTKKDIALAELRHCSGQIEVLRGTGLLLEPPLLLFGASGPARATALSIAHIHSTWHMHTEFPIDAMQRSQQFDTSDEVLEARIELLLPPPRQPVLALAQQGANDGHINEWKELKLGDRLNGLLPSKHRAKLGGMLLEARLDVSIAERAAGERESALITFRNGEDSIRRLWVPTRELLL